MQLADAVLPDSVQGPLKVPVLLVLRLNEPVGLMKLLGEESDTITVQDDVVPTVTGELHETVVKVWRGVTVTVPVPLL